MKQESVCVTRCRTQRLLFFVYFIIFSLPGNAFYKFRSIPFFKTILKPLRNFCLEKLFVPAKMLSFAIFRQPVITASFLKRTHYFDLPRSYIPNVTKLLFFFCIQRRAFHQIFMLLKKLSDFIIV